MSDLLFVNGTIETFADGVGRTGALAVTGGVVTAHGAEAEELRGPRTEVVDLGGGFAMPGLSDGHTHHALAGQSELFELTVPATAGVDELLDAVGAAARDRGPDDWVIGGTWGSGLLGALDDPATLARFDAATAGRPALLRDDTLHNRWANGRAMALTGIDAGTPDPPGGQILRDERGAPTGVLLEAGGMAIERALARAAPQSAATVAAACRRGIEILHSYGITAFQDAATSLQQMRALRALDDAGRLQAWVVSSMLCNDFIFGVDPLGEEIIAHADQTRSTHHRPTFVKLFLDGVPSTRTSAFLEPYLPDDAHGCDFHGATTMPPDELEHWLLSTARRGISAKVHCTGDAAVRMFLDAVATVRAAGFTGVRYQLAHGQFISDADLPRLAELDVVADISPPLWFPTAIAEATATVLPADRARRMQPNRTLLDTGAVLAAGSDWPVCASPNVWEAIYGLITRSDPAGLLPGTLWPEQAIGLTEAIRAYTTDSVAALGLDDVAGSLARGRSADLIVLTDDPHRIPVEQIRYIHTRQTWFAGEPVFTSSGA